MRIAATVAVLLASTGCEKGAKTAATIPGQTQQSAVSCVAEEPYPVPVNFVDSENWCIVWFGARQVSPDELANAKSRCEQGDDPSCLFAARARANACGVEQDVGIAAILLEAPCTDGYGPACKLLGDIAANDDLEASIAYYEQGCGAGDPSSCAAHAYELAQRKGETERVDAEKKLISLCDGATGAGCYELGMLNEARETYDAAMRAFRRGCDLGDPWSCKALAIRKSNHLESVEDLGYALENLPLACDNDFGDACSAFGVMYHYGDGVAADLEVAATYTKRGCELGYLHSCARYGDVLWDQGRIAEATAVVEYACQAGDRDGCITLGLLLTDEAKAKSTLAERAFACTVMTCNEDRDAESCNNMGFLYEEGIGVSEDRGQAQLFYELGCELGSALACNNLGVGKYADGNTEKAKAYHAHFARSCTLGSGRGCLNLGYTYQEEEHGMVDLTLAYEAFGKACELDEAEGCAELAATLLFGQGIDSDPAQGLIYGEKSCQLGHGESCDFLARVHLYGLYDQTIDKETARKFNIAACNLEHEEACKNAHIYN